MSADVARDCTPSGSFSRRDRILRRAEFEAVLRRGRRGRGAHLGVSVVLRGEAFAGRRRLGIAVSKRSGHAPARARLRRLLREAFRGLRMGWPALDLVVSCGTPWPDARLADVAAELDGLVCTALSRRAKR